MNQQLFFGILVFIAVFFIVIFAIYLFLPNQSRKRVLKLASKSDNQPDKSEFFENVVQVVEPLSKLSLPEEGWEKSVLQKSFINAGWREPHYPGLFFASKTLLSIILPLLVFLNFKSDFDGSSKTFLLFILLLIAGIGYYLPNVILTKAVEKRKLEITENFPDALDLLTVCVEAGLSFDQALSRVATEIKIKSETLANDLQLVLVEMRAGYSRERALRNLAMRTGVDDVESLATLIIQSERFGTSIGDSLRVQSDNLRNKRRVRAEEAAAKLSLKLLLPITVCIFPVFFVVVLGPTVIQIIRTMSPIITG